MTDRADQYVYGQPDKRLGDTDDVSRFRPKYRKLNEQEMLLHDEIKAQAVGMELLFSQVPDGRYKSLAMTALEQAVMWAVKGVTA